MSLRVFITLFTAQHQIRHNKNLHYYSELQNEIFEFFVFQHKFKTFGFDFL